MRESTAEQGDSDDAEVVTSLQGKLVRDRVSGRDDVASSRPSVCRDLFGRKGEVDNRPDWCEVELAKLSRDFAARWDLEVEPETNGIIITDVWEVCRDVPEVYLRMLEHGESANKRVTTSSNRTALTQRKIS
ncbi:unnamed protein product, partial [Ixodes hexagonus]